ncbi:hypothetical protein J4210_00160 [Candidatus Woesearchaeota archaeon]|nr:hypothetical protein [Candidatus Woesearchaeota archaeon]
MGWLSNTTSWVKKNVLRIEPPPKGLTVYQRDRDRREAQRKAQVDLSTRNKSRELGVLLKEAYDNGNHILVNTQAFQRLCNRQLTPYNTPAWKEKIGTEIIVPAVKYWEKIERIQVLAPERIPGKPKKDVVKMQLYRRTLSAVADKDFKESANKFLNMLQSAIKARQEQLIKLGYEIERRARIEKQGIISKL